MLFWLLAVLCGTILNSVVLTVTPQVKSRGLLPCLVAGFCIAVLLALLGGFSQSWMLFGVIVPFLQRRFMNLLKFVGPAVTFVVVSHYTVYSAVIILSSLLLHTVFVAIFLYFYPQIFLKIKAEFSGLEIEGLTPVLVIAMIIAFLNGSMSYLLSLFL